MNDENNNENLLERLANDIDDAKWDLLKPHHEREALFMITDELELAAVGFTMARDEVEYIKKWLADEQMFRPTDEQIGTWEEENTEFQYLIVQPYVLVKIKREGLN
ncbi:DUF2288 family protein [Halobacteriovorax sp. RZ-2]|uniref:DUF2288 family protein n=1 Tax=unclassified Halobacteriovorax TaxID=2639665 RepID=UPI0037221448